MDNDILDAPLLPRLDRPSPYDVIRSRLDYGINVFLLIVWLLCLMLGMVDSGILMFFAVVHFFLGCYQFLSALVGSLRGQPRKAVYLVLVIVYLLVVSTIITLFNINHEIAFLAFLGVLPTFGAVYYTKLSYDRRKEVAAAAERGTRS